MTELILPNQDESIVVKALRNASDERNIKLDLYFRETHVDQHIERYAKVRKISVDEAQAIAIRVIDCFKDNEINYDTLRTRLSGMGAGMTPESGSLDVQETVSAPNKLIL